jgi:hypothetical protein
MHRNGIYLVPVADCFSSIKIPGAESVRELALSFVELSPAFSPSYSTNPIDSASIDELFSSCAITPLHFNCLFDSPSICKALNHRHYQPVG